MSFDWIMAGIAAGDMARLEERCRMYEEALIRIRDNEGVVCNDFGSCDHAACRSSFDSWAIADQALC
jgi:hypothetical protein